MEDVDSLFIISLREVPSSFSSSISSIKDLENPEILIPLTITMLNLITQSEIPPEIPLTLSSKYKLCMKLAEMIIMISKSMSILYPNIKDIRNIVSCLLENLPKEHAPETILDESSSQLYWRKLKETIKNWASEDWKAPFDKIQQLEFRKIVSLHDGSDLKPELKKTWLQYQSEKVPVKTRIAKFSPLSLFTTAVQISQTLALKHSDNDFVLKTASNQKEAPTMNKQELTDSKLPSLIEVLERGNEKNEEAVGTIMMETDYNQIDEEILQSEESENISEEKSENPAEEVLENKDIINSENLENIENSENTEENPEKHKKQKSKEPVVESRQDEIDKLEQTLQDLNDQIQNNEALITTAKAELTKMAQTSKALSVENEQLKKELEQKHKLASALSDGSSNKIEEEIKELESRLKMMETEWIEYKTPIIEEIKEKETKIEKMKESYTDKIEEIKQMKEEMVEIAEEAEIKEEILEMLKVEDAKGLSSMNRNAFIKNISETTTKIKTQKKTIARIIKDINSMKSSVELSRESLKRIDSGTEDLVFQDAKKNSSSKVIYKLLVDLRENYDNLIRIVEEQYKLQTKISDFEIRIEAVMARNSKHDIEQLRSDLEKVKSES